VQFSATSHAPAAERQTIDDETNESPGQFAPEPVQFSATSQMPAEERQTVDDGLNASAGQVAAAPVQFSALSHTPAALRHTVALLAKRHAEVQHVLPAIAVSHVSPAAASMTPLPHRCSKLTVTKWPSVACVREGFPA
jgi:hypothetical protein